MSCPYQKCRSRTNIKTVLHSTLEDKFYWLFSKKKKDNFMFNVELSDETKEKTNPFGKQDTASASARTLFTRFSSLGE